MPPPRAMWRVAGHPELWPAPGGARRAGPGEPGRRVRRAPARGPGGALLGAGPDVEAVSTRRVHARSPRRRRRRQLGSVSGWPAPSLCPPRDAARQRGLSAQQLAGPGSQTTSQSERSQTKSICCAAPPTGNSRTRFVRRDGKQTRGRRVGAAPGRGGLQGDGRAGSDRGGGRRRVRVPERGQVRAPRVRPSCVAGTSAPRGGGSRDAVPAPGLRAV